MLLGCFGPHPEPDRPSHPLSTTTPVASPTGDELEGLLDQIVARPMKLLTRTGHLVEAQGMPYRGGHGCGSSVGITASGLVDLQAALGQKLDSSPGTNGPLDCLCTGPA